MKRLALISRLLIFLEAVISEAAEAEAEAGIESFPRTQTHKLEVCKIP